MVSPNLIKARDSEGWHLIKSDSCIKKRANQLVANVINLEMKLRVNIKGSRGGQKSPVHFVKHTILLTEYIKPKNAIDKLERITNNAYLNDHLMQIRTYMDLLESISRHISFFLTTVEALVATTLIHCK